MSDFVASWPGAPSVIVYLSRTAWWAGVVPLVLALLPALIGLTSPKVSDRPVTSAWLGRLVERRGRAILVASAVLLAPLIHRFLHHFHLELGRNDSA